MCVTDPELKCGDGQWQILAKILERLKQLVGLSGGGGGPATEVSLTVSDVQIGAVEIKDGTSDTRVAVMTTCPVGTEPGIVTRAIPCGTQPISAASLPLPTGAATEATLSDVLFFTQSIDNTLALRLPSLGFDALIQTVCPAGADPALVVRNIPCGTQAISAASLPLPTGAATNGTLNLVQADTESIFTVLNTQLDVQLSTRLSEATYIARTPTLGQKTMAGSSPIVIASDQSAIPVTGPLTDAQLRAAPVEINHAFDPTYGVFTSEITLGTATGRNRIISLFHPVGVTLDYEIVKVLLFFKVKHTAGVGQYKIQFTSVESATGTVLTPQQYHLGDANTGASVRSATTADGTLVGNPFIGYTMSLTPITGDPLGAMVPIYEHPGSPEEKPITLRASTAEGIIVFQDVTSTLTTAPILACRIVWREKLP